MTTEVASGSFDDPLFAGLLESVPPPVTDREAVDLVRRFWGIEGQVENLACERDANFHITSDKGKGYTLKISNPAEKPEFTNFQTEALRWLERVDPDLSVPRLVPSREGRFELDVPLSDGRRSIVRLLTWIEGKQLYRVGMSKGIPAQIGRMLARLGRALRSYDHPGATHAILWDIQNADRLKPLIRSLPADALRDQLEEEHYRFTAVTKPKLVRLRRQVIHNDFNHHNILMSPTDPSRIAGVLDFGDMVNTYLAIDVAVGASYLLPADGDPLGDLGAMLAAYSAETPLQRAEVELLRDLIVARLMTTIAITGWRAARYPQNAAYILRNNGAARSGMERFALLPRETVTEAFLISAGLE
ncbi:phosphotransferase [Arboricoccus pini]|nr:phosphotransferase [Arboricoccus pini]